MMSQATTRRARRGMLREWRLHILSVFSLAVAFVCLGASLLVVTNLKAVEERWAHAGRMSVYLADNASSSDVDTLKTALAASPHIKAVRYLSSAQARSDFGADAAHGKSELLALPPEAFPSSLEIETHASVSDSELKTMVGHLQQLGGVEDVETYEVWTERLGRFVHGGLAASGLLALVVLASVLAVVGSTIRLALQRRKNEVEVLKLVGATDRFIKGPFILEGSAQGAVGAAAAVLLLAVLFFIVRARTDGDLASLLGVEPTFLPWPVALGMVATGGILGAIAAGLGLRKLVAV
jgi:cell division transport system permease protein